MNTLQELRNSILNSRSIPGKKNEPLFKESFMTFDIETTRIPGTEYSIMYTWQISSSGKVNGEYPFYIGRTWEEFISFMNSLVEELKKQTSKLVVYVHNLNYEMIYLQPFFPCTDCIWLSPWNILKYTVCDGYIEFRDSYRLFNSSLLTVTKGLPHQKRNGEDFDYSKIRHSKTPLSEEEYRYCENDAVGLVEGIVKRMHDFGVNGDDNITSIPLTSTGFVRREIKNAKSEYYKLAYNDKLKAIDMTDKQYELLRQAFRGGNTHANRKYTGKILHNVKSFDRSSSYPDCLVNKMFPVTPFKDDKYIEEFDDGTKAYLLKLKLTNVRLKAGVTVPYIANSKCTDIVNSRYNDNGRIIMCDSLCTVVTDIDFHIIRRQYDFTYEVLECMSSEYGYLPGFIVDTVCKYYIGKTSLKGVEGCEIEYAKSKELLNSIYGMCVTDPRKDDLIFRYENESFDTETPNEQQKPVLPYQYGVWTTAHARECLQYGIDIAKDSFVYCDTDSIKVIADKLPEDFQRKLDSFNEKSKNDSIRHGGIAETPKGIKKYMGVFEYEETYEEFITYGAKKYCYRDETGLHITLSGVDKKCVEQLEDDITKYSLGFVFQNCKLIPKRTFFHNKPVNVSLTDYTGITEECIITDCVTLLESEYTLGIETTYEDLIRGE